MNSQIVDKFFDNMQSGKMTKSTQYYNMMTQLGLLPE